MKNNKKCTSITTGKIISIKNKGLDFPTMITVRYVVNGEQYDITESIKLKSEWIKIGFLIVGQKRVPIMGNTIVGGKVQINYEPNNPANAYITNNIGIANV